jgi:L-malate glycosyltransferase
VKQQNQKPDFKVLFLGNYLSAKRGTIGPSEIIAAHLNKAGIKARRVSSQEPKLFRAAEMLFAILTTRSRLVCADVFSGNIRTILPIVSRIARIRNKQLVLTLHGGQLPEQYERNPESIDKVFQRANCLLTPSLRLKAFFEKKGFQLQYLPNPVLLEHFTYSAPASGQPPRLLWVRAFADIYRPELAVDILGDLKAVYPKATLTMIGPDAGTLVQTQAHIAKKGLESSVEITGPIPHNQLGAYYRSHSVFLNTTEYESFGSAVLEAAASGIPIVSSAVGNIPLLWEDERELLIAKNLNAADFTEKIRVILEERPATRLRSEYARKKAEQFDVEIILAEWQRLVKEILLK